MAEVRQDLGKVAGAILGAAASRPDLFERVLGGIITLIGMFGKRGGGDKPVEVKTVPGRVEDDDDDIQAPVKVAQAAAARVPTRVRHRIQKVQLSRQRFPDEYTQENPFGLLSKGEVEEIQAGRGNMPYGSKFWHDFVLEDQHGKEFLHADLIAAGLAFKTVHTAEQDGVSSITGNGADPAGNPVAWEKSEEGAIGIGETAWRSSLGFNCQMKAFQEGRVVLGGSVAGIPVEPFTFTVS